MALNSSGLSVQHLDVEVTDTAQGTATGTLPVAPTYAYGQVRFLMVCRPAPTTPGCQPFTVRSGTVVVSVRGIRYVTTSPATLLPPPGSQTAFASIRAVGFGAGGNTGPGTIMAIENNPLPPGPSAQGVLQAFNYSAVSGGADAREAQVIQQSDVDAAREALAARVAYALGTEMMAKAERMTYVVDGSPTLDFTSDHAVGDEATSFTLSVTGKQSAKAFSDTEAKAILQTALRPQILPGYELAPDAIKVSYQFVQTADSPDVVVSASAVGYAVPKVAMSTVRARLKGRSVSDANTLLRQDFPGSSIDIRTKPLALPWLPMVGGNINLTMVIEPAT